MPASTHFLKAGRNVILQSLSDTYNVKTIKRKQETKYCETESIKPRARKNGISAVLFLLLLLLKNRFCQQSFSSGCGELASRVCKNVGRTLCVVI